MNRNNAFFFFILISSLLLIATIGQTYKHRYAGKPNSIYPLKTITLCLNDTNITFFARLGYLSEEDGIGILSQSLHVDTFQQIVASLSDLTTPKRDPKTATLDKAALILYYDIADGAGKYDIEDADLKGYSVYAFHSRRLYHEFFLRDRGGTYQLYSGLSAYTPSIYCSHSNGIRSTITDDGLPFRAHILLANKTGWDRHPRFTRNQLSDRIEKFEDEFWLMARQ